MYSRFVVPLDVVAFERIINIILAEQIVEQPTALLRAGQPWPDTDPAGFMTNGPRPLPFFKFKMELRRQDPPFGAEPPIFKTLVTFLMCDLGNDSLEVEMVASPPLQGENLWTGESFFNAILNSLARRYQIEPEVRMEPLGPYIRGSENILLGPIMSAGPAIDAGKDQAEQAETEAGKPETPVYFPQRPTDFNRWCKVWAAIRWHVEKGYSARTISRGEIGAKKPAVSYDTLLKIIAAGHAGLLDKPVG